MKRAAVIQQKTGKPVQFEVTDQTRAAVQRWIDERHLSNADFLFPSRVHASPHLTTRQYARVVQGRVSDIGLERVAYGTYAIRTKASRIYLRTKNLRAVQLLLGHTKLESTVRYLGIEVDDALEIAEHMGI